MSEKLRAACGTDCKKCPAYIAKRTNDEKLRVKTAMEWNKQFGANFTPAEISCDGCLALGEHSGYCFACPIRACVNEKKLPYCYACQEFATCQKRQEFEKHGGIKMASFFE